MTEDDLTLTHTGLCGVCVVDTVKVCVSCQCVSPDDEGDSEERRVHLFLYSQTVLNDILNKTQSSDQLCVLSQPSSSKSLLVLELVPFRIIGTFVLSRKPASIYSRAEPL